MRKFGILLVVVVLCGCGDLSGPVAGSQALNRRFEPVSDRQSASGGDFAVDTYTGTLCRTWEWTDSNQNPSLNRSWVADIPLCAEVAAAAQKKSDMQRISHLVSINAGQPDWEKAAAK